MPGSGTPRGLGLYLGRILREWDPDKAAKHAERAKSAGVRHIALCAEGSDGFVAPTRPLLRAAEVYRAIGAKLWVYSLPSARAWRDPIALADRLADAGQLIGASGWIGDVEETAIGMHSAVGRFFARLTERATERVSIGVTAYGRIPDPLPLTRDGDQRFPWREILGRGWLGYQLYETSADEILVRRRLADAEVYFGGDVIPHFASYERRGDHPHEGKDGAVRLLGDLTRASCIDGEVVAHGAWIWQDATLDRSEVAALRGFVDRAGW